MFLAHYCPGFCIKATNFRHLFAQLDYPRSLYSALFEYILQFFVSFVLLTVDSFLVGSIVFRCPNEGSLNRLHCVSVDKLHLMLYGSYLWISFEARARKHILHEEVFGFC